MTEKRKTLDLETMQFMGQIMEAQIEATQKIGNDLSDMGWRTAAEWAEKFRDLWQAVYEVNDSIKVERELMQHYGPDQHTIDHYLTMAHDDRAPLS